MDQSQQLLKVRGWDLNQAPRCRAVPFSQFLEQCCCPKILPEQLEANMFPSLELVLKLGGCKEF